MSVTREDITSTAYTIQPSAGHAVKRTEYIYNDQLQCRQIKRKQCTGAAVQLMLD